MSRVIKFKFWNHIVGRMTEKSYTLEELYKEKVNFTNLIPLQFTGLHDKNGVEIYEGDIIQTITSGFTTPSWNGKVLTKIVSFEDGLFAATSTNEKFSEERDYLFCFTHFEVIGNIYQNPTLL